MPIPTDNINEYRFGYSPEELKRLGNQHRVWTEDNRRFLARDKERKEPVFFFYFVNEERSRKDLLAENVRPNMVLLSLSLGDSES
jgi:hypothetical protein